MVSAFSLPYSVLCLWHRALHVCVRTHVHEAGAGNPTGLAQFAVWVGSLWLWQMGHTGGIWALLHMGTSHYTSVWPHPLLLLLVVHPAQILSVGVTSPGE